MPHPTQAPPKVTVTTARRAKEKHPRAAEVAARLDAPLVERRSKSTAAVLQESGAAVLYVVGADHDWVEDAQGRRCFVHPGRFFQRTARTPPVPLVRAVGAARVIVDGTCGLGQDALVLAGTGAEVLAYERSRVVHCLLDEGLSRLARRDDALGDAARRVTLLEGDVARADWPRGDVDCVVLDPMWDRTFPGAQEMQTLALVADGRGFSPETLRTLAARVPRLVMKLPANGRGPDGLTWTGRVQATRAAFVIADGSGEHGAGGE